MLIHNRIGMVVIDHDDIDTVDRGLLKCRQVLLGRSVVNDQEGVADCTSVPKSIIQTSPRSHQVIICSI
jgi:hypothetical protein